MHPSHQKYTPELGAPPKRSSFWKCQAGKFVKTDKTGPNRRYCCEKAVLGALPQKVFSAPPPYSSHMCID